MATTPEKDTPAPETPSNTMNITIIPGRTIRHNGSVFDGGQTVTLDPESAKRLIENCHAVAGSVLPASLPIIHATHPKAGSNGA